MKNNFLITIVVIIVVAASAAGVAIAVGNSPQVEEVPFTQTETTAIEEYKYIIKEHEGKIAVFLKEQEKPDIVFNVYTKYLPEYDRDKIKEGIFVTNYDQLVALIEDYTS